MSTHLKNRLALPAFLCTLGLAPFTPSHHALAGGCGSKTSTALGDEEEIPSRISTTKSLRSVDETSQPPSVPPARTDKGLHNTRRHTTDNIENLTAPPHKVDLETLENRKLKVIYHFLQRIDQMRAENETKRAPILQKVIRTVPQELRYDFVCIFKDCDQIFEGPLSSPYKAICKNTNKMLISQNRIRATSYEELAEILGRVSEELQETSGV